MNMNQNSTLAWRERRMEEIAEAVRAFVALLQAIVDRGLSLGAGHDLGPITERNGNVLWGEHVLAYTVQVGEPDGTSWIGWNVPTEMDAGTIKKATAAFVGGAR